MYRNALSLYSHVRNMHASSRLPTQSVTVVPSASLLQVDDHTTNSGMTIQVQYKLEEVSQDQILNISIEGDKGENRVHKRRYICNRIGSLPSKVKKSTKQRVDRIESNLIRSLVNWRNAKIEIEFREICGQELAKSDISCRSALRQYLNHVSE